jgi:hypothetical protein
MRSVLALGSVACDAYVGARSQRGCSAALAVNAGASSAMYIKPIEQEPFERGLR